MRHRAAISLLLAASSAWLGTDRAAADSIDRAIEFQTADGVIVHGVLSVPEIARESTSRPPLVILMHGFTRDRDSMLALSERLVDAGMATAALDMRGHGRSRQKVPTVAHVELYFFPAIRRQDYAKAADDVRILIDRLADVPEVDISRIGLVGVGTSGFVAASAAARIPAVDAVVIVDPPPNDGTFSPNADLNLVGRRPCLLICSSAPQSGQLAKALADYGIGERRVVCVDSFNSLDSLLERDAPATDEIVRWLAERLLHSGP